jgi:ferredoxin-type protein NapF
VRACPPAIVVRGDGGFPVIDFGRGGCTFCGACVDACAHGALRHDGRPALRLVVSIDAACLARRGVSCRTCGDACDASAIRFQLRPGGCAQPGVEHSLCTGCGSCIATCPVTAIRTEEAA